VTTLHLKGGRILDPAHDRDEIADVWVVDGRLRTSPPRRPAEQTLDVRGKVLVPGFIDLHVHLREPGEEQKETIQSGTRAAAAGGFTGVVTMPNTTPVIDSQTGVKFILSRAAAGAVVQVWPAAAVTRGQAGEEITEFGDLVAAGAVAFTDDGHPVMNNGLMRRALEYAAMFDVPILDHCQDLHLAGGGLCREGPTALRLGLAGWPSVAESIQVARDVELAAFTGGRVHICHVSAAESVEAIRRGKARGVAITAEVTPHHLTLTEAALADFDADAKCNPPLPSEADREALLEALLDDTLDAIATDHAPHTPMEKERVFLEAPNGVIGLETAFGVLHTELVLPGTLSLARLIAKLTVGPARILRRAKGTLADGADADVTILDLNQRWGVDPDRFFSRARNCPWAGRELLGRVWATIVGGRIVYQEGRIVA